MIRNYYLQLLIFFGIIILNSCSISQTISNFDRIDYTSKYFECSDIKSFFKDLYFLRDSIVNKALNFDYNLEDCAKITFYKKQNNSLTGIILDYENDQYSFDYYFNDSIFFLGLNFVESKYKRMVVFENFEISYDLHFDDNDNLVKVSKVKDEKKFKLPFSSLDSLNSLNENIKNNLLESLLKLKDQTNWETMPYDNFVPIYTFFESDGILWKDNIIEIEIDIDTGLPIEND